MKDSPRRSSLHTEYKTLRNTIVELTKQSKLSYYKNYFSANSSNLRKVWTGIKNIINIKGKSYDVPTCISDENGNIITDPIQISNIFCNQYSTVADKILAERQYEGDGNFEKYLPPRIENSLSSFDPITGEEIVSIIKKFNARKGTGPASIPTLILTLMSDELASPLALIANICFTSGIHPDKLKIAKVIPIFKKGSKLLPSNYRPISLLSNINKILEKLVFPRVFSFLEDNKILYKHQYGFRPKYSTNHALINITEKIRDALDQGKIAGGVFVDFQKAFDTVNHSILLKKLNHYGIRGDIGKWFASYLSNRKQFVSVLGFDSRQQIINHGVPQGSVLGPLLFLIYINDLHRSIKHSSTFHFADDTHLLTIADRKPNVHPVHSLQAKLNHDLKGLYRWLLANKISLNAAKTELIIFRKPSQKNIPTTNIKINGKRIVPVSYIKYLGIYLNEFLDGSSHCTQLQSKLQRANGMIAKMRHYLKQSPSDLFSIYHSIFSSHMIYGCQTWGLTENKYTKKIQTLQNRALRLITFADSPTSPYQHMAPIYKDLKLLKFRDLVTLKNLLFVHDYFNNNLPESFAGYFTRTGDLHPHNTRNASQGHLYVPATDSVRYGRKSFKLQAILSWNNCIDQFPGVDLALLPHHIFKRLIVSSFIDNYT
jgi:hypothetical protein